MQNQFQNLMQDAETGEVFNKAISQLAPEALNILWPEFEPIIARQVVNVSIPCLLHTYKPKLFLKK